MLILVLLLLLLLLPWMMILLVRMSTTPRPIFPSVSVFLVMMMLLLLFFAFFFFLPFFIVNKIVKNRSLVSKSVDDLQDQLALVRGHFLGVPAVRHRLVLIVLQTNVSQLIIRHVLHVDPFDLELTLEFVLDPHVARRVVVNSGQHLKQDNQRSINIPTFPRTTTGILS